MHTRLFTSTPTFVRSAILKGFEELRIDYVHGQTGKDGSFQGASLSGRRSSIPLVFVEQVPLAECGSQQSILYNGC